MITAKHKLNAASMVGAVAVAAMVGALTQSWLVFLIALPVLLTASVMTGEIRR